jgi:hypothetical protein
MNSYKGKAIVRGMDIDMGSDIVIEESDVDIKEEDMNL